MKTFKIISKKSDNDIINPALRANKTIYKLYKKILKLLIKNNYLEVQLKNLSIEPSVCNWAILNIMLSDIAKKIPISWEPCTDTDHKNTLFTISKLNSFLAESNQKKWSNFSDQKNIYLKNN